MNTSLSFPLFSSFSPFERSLLALMLLLFFVAILMSSFLAAVVFLDTHLRRPMFVLVANLSLVGVLGGTPLCPVVLRFLLFGHTHLSLAECLLQTFLTNLYTGGVFCVLALMALDRYVSICAPLRYHAIMSPPTLRTMLFSLYGFLVAVSALQVFLTSRLALCRFTIDKLMCDSLSVSGLACRRTPAVSAFGLFCSFAVVVLPCFLVVVSYVCILAVVRKAPVRSQRRAFGTCAPHFVTFANFSMASFFGVIHRRLSDDTPKSVNIAVCLVVLVFPPLLHPIVYGINMKEIRRGIRRTVLKHSPK